MASLILHTRATYIRILVCFHLLGNIHGNFIIDRKSGASSDEITLLDKKKDPSDVLLLGDLTNHHRENSKKYTCVSHAEGRRTIALSTRSVSKKTTCYTERELKKGEIMVTVKAFLGSLSFVQVRKALS